LTAQNCVRLIVLLESSVREKKFLQALEFLLGGEVLWQAAPDLIEKNVGSDATYSRMGSHNLREDFIARTTFVDHLLNPAHLPFDSPKAM
jgi:hypothetical protein